MIINIRYYVVMSASIFLALGVGIFIGFSLDGQEIFVEQQQGLINELEHRFLELRNESNAIEAEIKKKDRELRIHRELTEIILPRLVEDTLTGLNIAVIQVSGEHDLNGISSMLEIAGAQVTSITCLKGEGSNYNPNREILLKENLDEPVEDENLYAYMFGRLVNAIITGGDREFIELLKELGFIDVTGEYNGGVDFFIVTGGSLKEGQREEDVPGVTLIDAIKKCSIPVVGVEESGCESSFISQYRAAGISSVDNIDCIIGQYSLIKVLQGCVGHYGVKDTADAIIPDHPITR
jgi:hypothetical protein